MNSSSTRLIVSMLVVAGLVAAFWLLALAPKRQQADDLAGQISQLRSSLAASQRKAAEAVVARRKFPGNYQQLVVLGKAVPGSDDTSSLLIELNQVADQSEVKFNSIKLGAADATAAAAPAPTTTPTPTTPATGATGATPASATVPPTEAAAALLPLGATIGTAGFGVMPYDLTFSGDFFHVADFIKGIDSLVQPKGSHVAVDGRLMTLNGFALNSDPNLGFPHLQVTFSVTTYLTPPSQGVTAGASPTAPSATTPTTTTPATPAPTTTAAAPTQPAQ